MAFLENGNHTAVTEFILLGLTDDPVLRVILFTIILCIYLVTVSGNLIELSCSDDTVFIVLDSLSVGSIVVITVFVIGISYTYILITILKMHSTEGRQKAFSTCTSHLTAVTLFYGTVTFIYVMPKSSYSTDQNKMLSVFYMVVIPMLNPLIYSLRNNEIKGAMKRQLEQRR
ncbi:olfactory receptor 507, partial [Sigmodon hispidus]